MIPRAPCWQRLRKEPLGWAFGHATCLRARLRHRGLGAMEPWWAYSYAK
jgi:hypothetical protein